MARRTSPMRRIPAAAALIGLSAALQAPLAQDREALEVELGECIDLPTADERFECYEERVAEARRARGGEGGDERGDEPVVAAPEQRARDRDSPAPAAVERSTAVRSAAVREREADAGSGLGFLRDEEPTEIVSTIASLREREPNAYLITLENGQIWRQTRPKRYPMQPGQSVTLRSTNWGPSFRLTAGDLNSFIQVERVR